MIIGMDFGTTNTGAAVYDGRDIQVLPLDPHNRNPGVCRSAIYMTRTGEYYLGSMALEAYFDQNIGRPTRYEKVWVGEIEQVFAELPTFYRDVFVYEDVFSPGRLFLSIKTALRNREYYGTVFQGDWYAPSDLVAVFMTGMRMRIERQLGEQAREIVLGRPVRFSSDPQEDHIAQGRLLEAAFKAGFERVYLEYEPVAAALAYERTLERREKVLIFDFGGGTLDFTVIEIGASRPQRVLATGGIPIAGDVFDQRLFRAVIPPHLGEGEEFASAGKRYPIPAHIFDSLSKPHEILSLNTPENLEMLRSIHQGADDQRKTRALLQVVSSNYALLMFDRIEAAKQRLSSLVETRLELQHEGIDIQEWIPRRRFERAIQRDFHAIEGEMFATLERSGLDSSQVDRVVRTGGSSQIPLFVHFLQQTFGRKKVLAIDTFSSVTSGLAIRAHQVSTGLDELPLYTPDSLNRAREEVASRGAENHTQASRVDLRVVRSRLQTHQEFREGHIRLPQAAFVHLQEGKLRLFRRDGQFGSSQTPLLRAPQALAERLDSHSRVALVSGDQQLLLATSRFKLLASPLDALLLAQESSSGPINHALPVEADEPITSLTTWGGESAEGTWLCLLASTGQSRCFDLALLSEYALKRPYFQLERRYTGYPMALVHLTPGEQLLVGTDRGRAARAPLEEMQVVSFDVIRPRKGESITAAAAFRPGKMVWAVDDLGRGLKFDPAGLDYDGAPASRGQALRRNFEIVGFITEAELMEMDVFGLTREGHIRPLIDPRAEADPLVKLFDLGSQDRLVGVISPPGGQT
jgi:hypothetical chaperone protein